MEYQTVADDTAQLAQGRRLVVAVIVTILATHAILALVAPNALRPASIIVSLFFCYLLYQGVTWVRKFLVVSMGLVGIAVTGFGLWALFTHGLSTAWPMLVFGPIELAGAVILKYLRSARAFLDQQKTRITRTATWVARLTVAGFIPALAVGVVGRVYIPALNGFSPEWIRVLGSLAFLGLFCLVAVKLPVRKQPDGTVAPGDRERFPYPLVLWTSLIAFCAVAIAWAYSYAVLMPDKLKGTWQRYTTADGLPSNNVSAVAADDAGNVWFATDVGVSVLHADGRWDHYGATDGITETYDLLVDRRGRAWVAEKQISRFDGAGWTTFTMPKEDPGVPWRLATDGRGNVWALMHDGLGVIHEDDTFEFKKFPEFVWRNWPDTFTIDAAGHIWIGSMNGETICEYDPAGQQWYEETVAERIDQTAAGNQIYMMRAIAADREPGHLWVAAGSILEIDGESWKIHRPKGMGRSLGATAVTVDAEGYKWFVADGSILLLSPEGRWWRYQTSTAENSLPMWSIGGIKISRDGQGSYWFATESGAVRFTPENR